MREFLRRLFASGDEAQEGSVLVMVPAGLLVMILLGAMAVDLSLAFAGERRVADLAASIADAAAGRVDDDSFYATGGNDVALDQSGIAALLATEQAFAEDDPALQGVRVTGVFIDPRTIAVTVTADVPYLFLDAVPGMGSRRVDATSVATLVTAG